MECVINQVESVYWPVYIITCLCLQLLIHPGLFVYLTCFELHQLFCSCWGLLYRDAFLSCGSY